MGKIATGKRAGTALTRNVYKVLGIFTGTQSLSILCSLVRTKLVALWIGAAGVGLFGLYNSAIEMLSQLSQLGLRTSSVRDIAATGADSRDGMKMVALVRRWAVVLGISGMLFTLIISPLLSFITFTNFKDWTTFALLAVIMLLNSLTAGEQAVMQGRGALTSLAKSSLWATVAALLLSIPMLWIWRIKAVVPILILYSLSMTVAGLIYGRQSVKPFPEVTDIKLRSGISFLRLGICLTVSGFSIWFVSYLLMSWLRQQGGDQLAGFYQAGYTLVVRYVGVLFTAVAMEFYPRLSTVTDSRRRMKVYLTHEIVTILRIGAPLAVAFIFLSPFIIRLLYSEEFMVIVPYVTMAVSGIILRAVSWCIGYVIVAKADGKVFMILEVGSAILYLFLTIWLYTLRGIEGFGWAFTLWYLIYLVAVMAVCRVRYDIIPGRTAWIWCIVSVTISGLASAWMLL